jgi:hypothetical protein
MIFKLYYLRGGNQHRLLTLQQKGFVVSVVKLFLMSVIETDIIHKIQKIKHFDISHHDPTPKISVIVSVAYTSRHENENETTLNNTTSETNLD